MTDTTGDRLQLWLDPGFGAAGDMILGALLGLGAPIEQVRSGLATLEVEGWSLDQEKTQRCSLASNRALVHTDEGHHHRTWSSIDAMLAGSELTDAVKAGSRATFRRLGEVEAGIHNVTIDEVHFHEVGAIDAIVDIVGSWLALDALGVSTVTTGPVGLGRGSVTAAHGRLPVPAPATAELLVGATIQPVDVEAETVTPTGAALLSTMTTHWGSIPSGQLYSLARGAGRRDPAQYPNVVTAYLVSSTGLGGAGHGQTDHSGTVVEQQAVMITTNVDDVTAEVIGHVINRCLSAGADDAWAVPIIMKKARPAHELKVLCQPAQLEALRQIVFAETGTLGMRVQPVAKHVLPRRFDSVVVDGHSIAMKVGPYGVKPEYEDLASASEDLQIPVRELANRALSLFAAGQSTGEFDDMRTEEFANREIPGQTHSQ